jgi:hypothetical protein
LLLLWSASDAAADDVMNILLEDGAMAEDLKKETDSVFCPLVQEALRKRLKSSVDFLETDSQSRFSDSTHISGVVEKI